jgi:hypothetical protein
MVAVDITFRDIHRRMCFWCLRHPFIQQSRYLPQNRPLLSLDTNNFNNSIRTLNVILVLVDI